MTVKVAKEIVDGNYGALGINLSFCFTDKRDYVRKEETEEALQKIEEMRIVLEAYLNGELEE